ncbi:MAG: hypothetical protein ACREQY_14325, partial [Candidatus Binatia bacterium]
EMLRALFEKKRALAGVYEHGRVLEWTGEILEVGFATQAQMFGEIAKEKLEEMKSFLKDQTGKPVDVRIKFLDEAESSTVGKSVVEASREKQVEEKKRRESEAREHPVTKLVLDTFGASIKEIKTDV